MAYSPNGNYLAVGGHDDTLYVYSITNDGRYQIHYTNKSHSSGLTALDWTIDSKYIRSIDQAYQKIFSDIEEADLVYDGSHTLTDYKLWATSTCKLGWDTMGVYPLGADGTDINHVYANENRTLVAAGDDSATITVYRFPCMKNTQ